MSDKNVLGLIFSNLHDESINDLTRRRTMGSVLFGGRYRLIDFPLSAMVNSGVGEVGVITKKNYQSLLDHLGNGREWDMSRKNGGLHLLPPFSHNQDGIYRGRLEALYGVWEFVMRSNADYILLSDCDIVANMEYDKIIDAHIASGADITAVYAKGNVRMDESHTATVFGVADNGQIADVLISPEMSGDSNISLNTYVIGKTLLKNIVMDAKPRNLVDFEKDVLQAKVSTLKLMGYEYTEYYSRISSMQSYFEANLALLNTENRRALFKADSPIYTKVRDNPPAKYGINASVKNSLIGDGCIVDGKVENCILFRGVKVGAGTSLKNCIIMQDTVIGKKCGLQNVITDKKVTITDGRLLTGSSRCPLFLAKESEI
ncbi:MAG: glucose-1-phosphate adenylyltransferase subunit GlgD [Ruminococcus sp.]|jgi:glucose-1-phosphate adenylyltransferase|nr:glucose-1-phosphate adenylyltransferase subunit GlgD [Ruminococcus sp.]